MLLAWIVVFSLLGSAGAVLLAGSLLLFPDRTRQHLIPCLISFATGTLLGAAFLGLIPHALKQVEPSAALPTVLGGILVFFVLEKILLWRHCHDAECEAHGRAGSLILLGDAFHNFADGVVLAAAFLTSLPLGVATALAIIAHEIPQEVGDFAILVDSGYAKGQALFYNVLSSLGTLPGALLGYSFLREARLVTPFIMAFSAASFIYVATVDLIPGLHRRVQLTEAARQFLLILAGIGTILLFHLHW
jgi:zinc and cadmium transporter